MEIDVFSDPICPWCFIGKRRLERALETRPQGGAGARVTIRWRAFQLNPDMPPEGMDRRRYLEAKFGAAANAEAIYDRIRAAGRSEEIAFAFDRMTRTPNTIAAHRLIRFAGTRDCQGEVVEALFQAYFLRAEDIGAHAVLTEAAEAAGLEAEDVRAFLAGDAETEEVTAEDRSAREAGISGVPCFIFNGKHALAGAHPPEVLFQLFDLARAEADPDSAEA